MTIPDGLDEGLEEFIMNINKLPGVTTLQSCSGHKQGEDGRPCNGEVWVLLSPSVERIFEGEVDEFTRHPCIESVAKLYGRGDAPGFHPISIEFRGLNWSPEWLTESLDVIYNFFRKISEEGVT